MSSHVEFDVSVNQTGISECCMKNICYGLNKNVVAWIHNKSPHILQVSRNVYAWRFSRM